ncbi:efflux RND transporter periplasmic adaptor subunit [Rosistilla oblonga]|uniref:efflux RND transporter periplasmic adaptor subunit n=1 Tax=Rosistilla oblonga TaxID=2527990 RepID=UPI003A97CED3
MCKLRKWFASRIVNVSLAGVILAITPAVAADPLTNQAANGGYDAFTEPLQSIDVAAAEPGRIAKVFVKPGARVEADALLMALDTQVLRAIRAIAVVQAETTAEVDSLRIEHKRLEHRYQRLLELRSQGAGSPDEVLHAETDAKIAQLRVQTARDRQRIAELEIAEIDARIAMKKIRSPIAGIVTEVVQDVGEYVAGSEPTTVRVVDLSALRAVFYLPTSLATQMQIDQTLTLRLTDSDETVKSTIRHIDPVTNAESGRVGVEVIIANPNNRYRSGLRCRLDRPHHSVSPTPN